MIRKTLLVISLLLLVGTVGLWVTSHWAPRNRSCYVPGVIDANLFFADGVVAIKIWVAPRHSVLGIPPGFRVSPARPSRDILAWYMPVLIDIPYSAWTFGFTTRCWYVAGIILTLQGWLVYRAELYHWLMCKTKWYRRRHNLCLTCGYDLTGNVSGVCSECGVEVERLGDRP